MKQKIEIIFEDNDIVVVDKPANVLTIPDRHRPDKKNVYHFLNNKYGKVFIIHRLDRETSGILCFAKNEMAHKHMSQQFENRTVDKYYYALVEGSVYQKEGEINKPIAKSQAIAGKMVINKRGKESLTLYKVLEHFKNYTLVEANIKTGRTHQVRIHFESIGHPLAIDPMYGRKSAFLLSEIKGKKYNIAKHVEERPLMSRTTLHAKRISFDHPTTLERMTFETDLPKDFNAILKQLRKWGS